jgi:hypothetical protein
MKVGILFIIFLILLKPLFSQAQSMRDSSKYRMSFYDFNFGINAASTGYSNSSEPNNAQTNKALGFSEKLQSSFVARFMNTKKKLLLGDILSAGIGTGFLSSHYSKGNSNLWLNYHFEFGIGTIFRIDENNDLGLNLMLLMFGRDDISQNLSGSDIVIRYRYKKCLLETGTEARRERIFGWITSLQKDIPLQYVFGARYLIDGRKNAGITCEWLPGKINQGTDYFNNIWSMRLFYGIYF